MDDIGLSMVIIRLPVISIIWPLLISYFISNLISVRFFISIRVFFGFLIEIAFDVEGGIFVGVLIIGSWD